MCTYSQFDSILVTYQMHIGCASAGHKEEIALQESQIAPVLSPEGGDVPQGSSLELSPSNSSGGTYMWDEEGFEPLGGLGMHPCDSYDDSDLNSMVSLCPVID